MSLLTGKAPHRVEVQRRRVTRDARGLRNYEKDGERVPVRCGVEPVRDWASAEENKEQGVTVLDMLIIRSKQWPGDENALIYFEGGEYETIGRPQHFSKSRRTSHWRVTAKWIGKDMTP